VKFNLSFPADFRRISFLLCFYSISCKEYQQGFFKKEKIIEI